MKILMIYTIINFHFNTLSKVQINDNELKNKFLYICESIN